MPFAAPLHHDYDSETMTRIKSLIGALALAGCAGGNAIDQGVPTTALSSQSGAADATSAFPPPAQPDATRVQQPVAEEPAVASVQTTAGPAPTPPPVNTLGEPAASPTPPPLPPRSVGGAFPQLGDEPASRLNPADLARNKALADQLDALRAQQESGQISAETYRLRLAELQRLGASHSDETLARIRAQ